VAVLLYAVLLQTHLRHLQLSWPQQHQVMLPLQLSLLLLVLLLLLLLLLLLEATKGVQEGPLLPLLLLLQTVPRSSLSAM
jgi:hypothetical protein